MFVLFLIKNLIVFCFEVMVKCKGEFVLIFVLMVVLFLIRNVIDFRICDLFEKKWDLIVFFS